MLELHSASSLDVAIVRGFLGLVVLVSRGAYSLEVGVALGRVSLVKVTSNQLLIASSGHIVSVIRATKLLLLHLLLFEVQLLLAFDGLVLYR